MLNMNIMSLNENLKTASYSLGPHKGNTVFQRKGCVCRFSGFVLEMSCGGVEGHCPSKWRTP